MKLTLIALFVLLSYNKAYEQPISINQDPNIVSDLILIRNTYNYVDNKKVRFEMIRRQNKLVGLNERYLYEQYLIKVEGEVKE